MTINNEESSFIIDNITDSILEAMAQDLEMNESLIIKLLYSSKTYEHFIELGNSLEQYLHSITRDRFGTNLTKKKSYFQIRRFSRHRLYETEKKQLSAICPMFGNPRISIIDKQQSHISILPSYHWLYILTLRGDW